MICNAKTSATEALIDETQWKCVRPRAPRFAILPCVVNATSNVLHVLNSTQADYNPDPKDCSNATAILNQQSGYLGFCSQFDLILPWDIPVGGTKVVKYNTCTYYFVNQGHNTINFCDTALVSCWYYIVCRILILPL
jgi:hypothetical protein